MPPHAFGSNLRHIQCSHMLLQTSIFTLFQNTYTHRETVLWLSTFFVSMHTCT